METKKFKQFINPHQHSDGSNDGAATVDQIVARNVELGATHVAITEHGNLNTGMALYMACKKRKVKPILGIELYVKSPFEDYTRARAQSSRYRRTVAGLKLNRQAAAVRRTSLQQGHTRPGRMLTLQPPSRAEVRPPLPGLSRGSRPRP